MLAKYQFLLHILTKLWGLFRFFQLVFTFCPEKIKLAMSYLLHLKIKKRNFYIELLKHFDTFLLFYRPLSIKNKLPPNSEIDGTNCYFTFSQNCKDFYILLSLQDGNILDS